MKQKQRQIDLVEATWNPAHGIKNVCPFPGPYGDAAALRIGSKVAGNASDPKEESGFHLSPAAEVRRTKNR